MPTLEYRLITRDAVYERLDKAFNPPELADSKFEDEFFEVDERIRTVLSEFGTFDDYGQQDFFRGCVVSPTMRHIGISVTSPAPVTSSLVPTIMRILKGGLEAYEVCMSFDYLGGISPILFVDPNKIEGDLSPAFAKELGLNQITEG